MRLFEGKTRCLFFIILAIMSCLSASVVAQSNEASASNDGKLFGLGGEIGYVAPYVWRGIPLTDGPCIQPQFWASFRDFKLGVFINMYGSNKDRDGWHKVETNEDANTIKFDPLTKGEASRSFGMINEVNFSLNWEHSFTEVFSLLIGYTQYAYGEYIEVDTIKNRYGPENHYGWFHDNSWYGEFTLRPSFKLGNINLFTEQNFVLIAPDRSFLYRDFDPTGLIWAEMNDSRFGSWHCVLGVNIEKELSDKIKCYLLVQQEIANWTFFETLFRDPEFIDPDIPQDTVSLVGAYQQTVNFLTEFTPYPWFLVSVNCGIEFINKEKISKELDGKQAIVFGGIHTRFSFSR